VGIVIHWIIFRPKSNELFGPDRRLRILDPLRCLVFLFTLFFIPQKLNLAGVFRKLIFLLALLCFAILFVTGFYSKIIYGTTISGYWLMIHATAAPIFAVCIAILSVMWAQNCRLNKNYWPWLQKIIQRETTNKAVPEKHELIQKICFWLIIILAIPLILSIILSMFTFFGTYWQNVLADTHRYCALLFATIVIVHTYLFMLIQAGSINDR
jgi:cytochrome b subunit of formate dehydrogenase